jgi:hypothetical protein
VYFQQVTRLKARSTQAAHFIDSSTSEARDAELQTSGKKLDDKGQASIHVTARQHASKHGTVNDLLRESESLASIGRPSKQEHLNHVQPRDDPGSYARFAAIFGGKASSPAIRRRSSSLKTPAAVVTDIYGNAQISDRDSAHFGPVDEPGSDPDEPVKEPDEESVDALNDEQANKYDSEPAAGEQSHTHKTHVPRTGRTYRVPSATSTASVGSSSPVAQPAYLGGTIKAPSTTPLPSASRDRPTMHPSRIGRTYCVPSTPSSEEDDDEGSGASSTSDPRSPVGRPVTIGRRFRVPSITEPPPSTGVSVRVRSARAPARVDSVMGSPPPRSPPMMTSAWLTRSPSMMTTAQPVRNDGSAADASSKGNTERRPSRGAAEVARVALREWARIEECNRMHSHLPGGLVVDDEGRRVQCSKCGLEPLRWGMLDNLP